MRIFIGLREIANITATLAHAFQNSGHTTRTIIMRRNHFYTDSLYDVVVEDIVSPSDFNSSSLSRIKYHLRRQGILIREFIRTASSCDIFIYVFASSFLPGYLDYFILKLLGKRIVSIFCGSDIRYWYAYNQEFYSLGLGDEYVSRLENPDDRVDSKDVLSIKIRRVRAAERFSDLILSQPIMAQLQTRPYMRMNIPLNLSKYKFNVPARKEPLILHAPSNRKLKGTEGVLSALDKLKREGVQFEFKLIENIPNAQLRTLLTDSDIVIDQLLGQTVATFAIEAMATGNVVMARYLPERVGIPPDCPVINVTTTTLADKLRNVIQNIDLRRTLAFSGRPYVEAHHSHIRVAQQFLDWLEPGGITEYDFTPIFYKTKFVMPLDLLREERRVIWKNKVKRILDLFSRSSNGRQV